MTVSATFKAAVLAQETDEVPLVLLTIDHDSLDAPLRFVNNPVDIESNGETYTAFPFEFQLPPASPDSLPFAQLTIDNVDRQIVEAVRSIPTAPTVSAAVILASDPDTIEAPLPEFYLFNIQYDQLTVTGTLVVSTLDDEPFPAWSFMPSFFPGLFGGVA